MRVLVPSRGAGALAVVACLAVLGLPARAAAATPAGAATGDPVTGHFNVGATHSPQLEQALAGAQAQVGLAPPAATTGAASGMVQGVNVASFQHPKIHAVPERGRHRLVAGRRGRIPVRGGQGDRGCLLHQPVRAHRPGGREGRRAVGSRIRLRHPERQRQQQQPCHPGRLPPQLPGGRQQHHADHAGHRVQPVPEQSRPNKRVLLAHPGRHGGPGSPAFDTEIQRQDRPAPDYLHHPGLVEHLHRRQHRLRPQPGMGRRRTAPRRARRCRPGWGNWGLLAIRQQRHRSLESPPPRPPTSTP